MTTHPAVQTLLERLNIPIVDVLPPDYAPCNEPEPELLNHGLMVWHVPVHRTGNFYIPRWLWLVCLEYRHHSSRTRVVTYVREHPELAAALDALMLFAIEGAELHDQEMWRRGVLRSTASVEHLRELFHNALDLLVLSVP